MSNATLGSLPSYQCYDCRVCGKCCGGYLAVAVTPQEAERILAQGWQQDPAMQHGKYFTRRGGKLFMAHRPDGRCVFLDDENRCRIHAKFGEAAKAMACRLYPFVFIPAGQECRVDIRYDCPAVAENEGRPLTGHRKALLDLYPQVVPEEARDLDAPPLLKGSPLDWTRLHRITLAFDTLLHNERTDLTRRIVSAVNLAAALATPGLVLLEMPELEELLKKAMEKLSSAAGNDPLARVEPNHAMHVMFRQLLAVYSRRDGVHERPQVMRRFTNSMRMVRGQGPVPPLRPDLPEVDFATLDESFGIPNGMAAEVLVRYYRMRLWSMSFCGRGYYNQPYLDGLNAMWLTYPIILWFARLYAAGEGKTTLEHTHIEKALQIVDHQHGRTPLLNVGAERYRQRNLCERSTLRSFVVWYGA